MRRPVVLTDVTVVDPRDGSRPPHQDVRLDGGRIAAIGATGAAAGAETVDGAGRVVVPGFVDMHSQAPDSPQQGGALELMLAHGITGFRQMSGTTALLRRRRAGGLGLPARCPARRAPPGRLL